MIGTLIALLVLAIPIWLMLKALGIVSGAPSRRDPKIIITLVLVVLNLVTWATIPFLWGIITLTWYTWVFFNLGLWFLLYLLTIRVVGPDGNDTKVLDPTARKGAILLAVILITGFISATAMYVAETHPKIKQVLAEAEMEQGLPPILRVIRRHNQWDTRFRASCKPCHTRGTYEAVRDYETKGLLPWQNSMRRWETEITNEMIPFTLAVVEAPSGGAWSKSVKIPAIRGGAFADWPDAPPECELSADGDEENVYPCEGTSFEEPVSSFRFRSNGPKPFRLEIIVRK